MGGRPPLAAPSRRLARVPPAETIVSYISPPATRPPLPTPPWRRAKGDTLAVARSSPRWSCPTLFGAQLDAVVASLADKLLPEAQSAGAHLSHADRKSTRLNSS